MRPMIDGMADTVGGHMAKRRGREGGLALPARSSLRRLGLELHVRGDIRQ